MPGGSTTVSYSPRDLTGRAVATTRTAPGNGRVARVINDKKAKEDYDAIKAKLLKMVWSGNFGPSVSVETKLKWDNAACRQLYLKLKDELHDKKIPGKNLYYYVG